MNPVEDAQRLLDEAIARLEEQDDKMRSLPEDTPDEERSFHDGLFEKYEADVSRRQRELERQMSIQKAYAAKPEANTDEPDEAKRQAIRVVRESKTYERGAPHSYFRDVWAAGQGDGQASARLNKHQQEAAVELRDPELRAVTSSDPGAGTFIPPLYMGSEWIDKERFRRPFADNCASVPLSPHGKQMDFPRTQTAPTVAAQATEGSGPSATDFDGETYSVPKATIAGQNDWSIQAYEWSQPGADEVVMRELVKAYNAELDRQLLAGSGGSGEHTGIRSVSSINTQTFSSGNAAALLGKIYAGFSDVATNAPGYQANAVVMHPRRGSWMASHRDGNSNLLQSGDLVFAAGRQDRGFAGSLAGIGALLDGNIATNRGASTNEDEVYLVDFDELYLAEGPLRVRTMSEVLSGTLQVRLQVFAYSAFAGGRRPKVICKISGAGLATPTFPST